MCFTANLAEQYLQSFIALAQAILSEESAPGSDPGLCVVMVDALVDPALLIAFGQRAKKYVLTKEDAYAVAGKLRVHLSEHGGTGQGVIGALAGAGLRLTGNDGRLQGQERLPMAAGGTAMVAEILSQTKVELVRSLDGLVMAPEARVFVGDWLKLVLLDNKAVLLVRWDEERSRWRACSKQELKDIQAEYRRQRTGVRIGETEDMTGKT